MNSAERFKIAKDRVRIEREQLTAMSTRIRIKSVASERIREAILRVVAEVFEVPEEEIEGRSRLKRITVARHAYCLLCTSLDPMATLTSIGETIGRDHSTVINSIKKCNDMRETDYLYASQFQRCIEKIADSTDEELKRINFQPEHLQRKNTKRQRDMQRAILAIDIVTDFMKVWDEGILQDGFNQDPKAFVAAFNDIRTKAALNGF